jgi:hypothetical protein
MPFPRKETRSAQGRIGHRDIERHKEIWPGAPIRDEVPGWPQSEDSLRDGVLRTYPDSIW